MVNCSSLASGTVSIGPRAEQTVQLNKNLCSRREFRSVFFVGRFQLGVVSKGSRWEPGLKPAP